MTTAAQRVRLIAPLSVMAGLWILSSIPATPGAAPADFVIPAWLQNALHVPVYGVLCAAWFWVFDSERLAAAGGFAFAVTTAYGLIDEIHQGFVPGRTAAAGDLTLDAAGAALALVLIAVHRMRTHSQVAAVRSRI